MIEWIKIIFIFAGLIAFIILLVRFEEKSALRSSGVLKNGISVSDVSAWGVPRPEMICPHCQQKGKVLARGVAKKTGISGAKATGAILTGGVSLLATGLSKKDKLTQAHCINCDATWHF